MRFNGNSSLTPAVTVSTESAGQNNRRSLYALDGLNFFMADITGGIGPFLAIYLKTSLHLDPANVGFALATGDLCALLAQTPAGALVDAIGNKRMIVIAATLVMVSCCLVLAFCPDFRSIIAAQVAMGCTRAFFPAAVAAITLGLVGHAHFAKRSGRNAAFDHAGNVFAALLCGLVSKLFSLSAIFVLIAGMAIAGLSTILAIDPKRINANAARGLESSTPGVSVRDVLLNQRMFILIGCVALFHFANAAMLPQVGQKVAESKIMDPGVCMAACIIVAQLTMVPTALIASKLAISWGRKPVFLIGFLSLPLRAALFALDNNPYHLIAAQILDGIGAGIFSVISLIVIADLTRGTGRFNLVQGVLATGCGIGAGLSNLVIGIIVAKAGYNAGFSTLAGIALLGTVCFALLMPETKHLSLLAEGISGDE